MMNDYFLGALLPRVSIEEPPELGACEYEQLLKENLSASALVHLDGIRSLYDMMNLRRYWQGKPLDGRGRFDKNELQDALATESGLPSYVFEFINRYQNDDERVLHFSHLLSAFFIQEGKHSSGFVKAYLNMEREIRLMLVAYRAKKLFRDLPSELQYEDPEEPFVAQILAQKDAAEYTPPEAYEDVKVIFHKYGSHPVALEKALLEFRLQKIEELSGRDQFSVGRILAYFVQVTLIEEWQQMNQHKGLKIVDSMLKDIS